MREIGLDDLVDIATGAAILGTGGGGDPYIGRLMARAALRETGPVKLTPLAELPDDAVVLPVASMGAPTVMVEKLPAADELSNAVEALCGYLGRRPTHLACAEAGGVNSLIPVAAAARTGLPLIDADGMGRAFPELQMFVPGLYGVKASPMAMSDDKGNRAVIHTVDNHWTERLARAATVEMGGSSTTALYAMTGKQAREFMVPGTLSLCAELGALVERHRATGDTAEAVAGRLGGRVLFTGKILDVERRTVGGFARGTAKLTDGSAELRLSFQNEHLLAELDGVPVATTPDLICVLDQQTGFPVTTEATRYGQRVTVLVAPCDPRWHTPEGLALVGPRYFGYDLDPVAI
ncbi:DUF917 domain-containing protein [Streptosporangium lutulentum]|uniref:DUF917 family protein n=1 Tax=Streptosporangium lutulentum TaxID=1461250 RepID=A0ABT9Q4J1_9ACTN|nr:DUF917 domain-containing protein [Streptosporangium lutulentum]MDP9841263.1 DUF917 family protein [Streptosporangium lutulentum]